LVIKDLVRPNILALKPYSSARDEFKLLPPATSSKFEVRTSNFELQTVFLDANENSLGSPLDTDYSRYPDPQQGQLKQAVGRIKQVEPSQIFLGNGSDEAIDLLMRAFVEPARDNVLILPPTYGMYAVQANIQGAEIRRVPLRPNFSPDSAAVRAATDAHSKLLFLCSPNNPTGQCLSDDFVLEMLRDFPGLVVMDEAYADFSGKPSWISRLDEFPNLVVLQTLSKAWGLAGLRVGMAFSTEFVVSILNKIKYPYNISTATINLVATALEKEPEMREMVRVLLAGRVWLEAELLQISCVREVFPSDSNFLLVRVTNANDIYRYLTEHGLIVRDRSSEIHCENCLRITVGTPAENERLISVLQTWSD